MGRELWLHTPATGETIRLTGPRTQQQEKKRIYLPFVQLGE